MFRIDDELANHSLDYAYIAIERAAKEAAEKCNPKVQ